MKQLIVLLTTMASTSLPLVLILDRTQCWNCTTPTPQVRCHWHHHHIISKTQCTTRLHVSVIFTTKAWVLTISMFSSPPVKIQWQGLMRLRWGFSFICKFWKKFPKEDFPHGPNVQNIWTSWGLPPSSSTCRRQWIGPWPGCSSEEALTTPRQVSWVLYDVQLLLVCSVVW